MTKKIQPYPFPAATRGLSGATGDQKAKADRYLDAILEVYSPYARPKVMLFFGTGAEWKAITKGARDFLHLRRKYA